MFNPILASVARLAAPLMLAAASLLGTLGLSSLAAAHGRNQVVPHEHRAHPDGRRHAMNHEHGRRGMPDHGRRDWHRGEIHDDPTP